MTCTNCKTPNGPDDLFCVNCGNPLASGGSSFGDAGQPFNTAGQPQSDSTETVVNFGQSQFPTPNPYSGQFNTKKKNPAIWVAVALLAIGLIGVGAFLLIPQIGGGGGGGEVLPDHLGMFVQAETKDRYDEIRKQDFTNALDGKAALIKDENLPTVPPLPGLLFYADSKDTNVDDMRLVQLETMKDDGSMKQIDFQVLQVEGKPAMKRMRVIEPLANGKYAFALFDSYLNEGKQKFWPFQVRNSSKSDNGAALKDTSVPIKPKEPVQKAPVAAVPNMPAVPPPPSSGGTMVRSNTKGLILRDGPSQYSRKIRNLGYGEWVEVIGYSDNYEMFKGRTARFVQVRTTNGQIGWAFEPYLSR